MHTASNTTGGSKQRHVEISMTGCEVVIPGDEPSTTSEMETSNADFIEGGVEVDVDSRVSYEKEHRFSGSVPIGLPRHLPPSKSQRQKNIGGNVRTSGNRYTLGRDEASYEDNNTDVDMLSWRVDPEESLSDWTIVVKTKRSDKAPQEYHVHKSVLGAGPRRSQYFANAFRQVEEAGDKARFIQQSQKHHYFKKKEREDDILFLGEFFEQSCEFVMAGATPLLDMVGAEHRYGSSERQATCLELEEPAAKAFPALLDYAYGIAPANGSSSSKKHPLAIDTKSATALHSLAVKLEMKLLRREARSFWKHDLCMQNLLIYYHQARLFGDELISQYAAGCLSVSILDLEEREVVDYLRVVDADFMAQVLEFLVEQQSAQIRKCSMIDAISSRMTFSKRLSLLVAIYCNLHRDKLKLSTLHRLTDAKFLPELDAKAAQVLLQLENDISGDCSALTSLKCRCIAVLAESWDHLHFEDAYGGHGESSTRDVSIPKLEGPALAHFVVRSLTKAKHQLAEMENIRREWKDIRSSVGMLNEQVELLLLRERQEQDHPQVEPKELSETASLESGTASSTSQPESPSLSPEEPVILPEAVASPQQAPDLPPATPKTQPIPSTPTSKKRTPLPMELAKHGHQSPAISRVGSAAEPIEVVDDSIRFY